MMEKKWTIKEHSSSFHFGELKKYHPLILALLAKRGIVEPSEVESFFYFDYSKNVADPFLFKDMERAVERIARAKERGEKIVVFGDYDADGVTATALLFEVLTQLGFKDVAVYIPDRQLEGYGMNMEAIRYLHQQNARLLITVDCGITNVEEVEKIKELGMDVIVTDHHHVLSRVPEAFAVINPRTSDSGYPFKNLSGVGLAFKLAQALYQRMDPDHIDQLKWLLDLVAIGTIADCVPLLGENRVLVKYGLVVLSKTRRVGIQEMCKVGRIAMDENNAATAHKVAFQIAPRINASGRMDHANFAYNLIVEKDTVRARDMALEVEIKNQERQKVTSEVVREIKYIAENSFKDKNLIFAYHEHWQVGILGLVAGKIADEFHKPTVVLQKQEKEFVGSLRSIPRVNIIESLEQCAELLIKFGGHSQAAGVRVSLENIGKFYDALSRIVETALKNKESSPEIQIDLEISSEDIHRDIISELEKMEPFGEGNKEPVFLVSRMKVLDARIVGNGAKHLKLSLTSSSDNDPKIFNAIGFGMGEKFRHLKKDDIIDIVCTLSEDEWNGGGKVQLKLVDIKYSEDK